MVTTKKQSEKKLILVESPTKVKTIKKFVDNKYEVLATKGHIIDLPKSKLGVDIENNFEPTYIVLRDKMKTLSELKKAIKKVDEVYLATDPDREGEAICWHIKKEIEKTKNIGQKKFYRVLFNEITKQAVLNGLSNPGQINLNLVNAQQARRILDRLVGYKISPLLWKAIRKGLSAGRVQSVALKLIVERQREIDNFKPVEYWNIFAILQTLKQEKLKVKLIEKDGKKLEIKNKQESEEIVNDLKNQNYIVSDVIKKERKRKPLPPFITSTLQQDAARKLYFNALKTMKIAQELYEGVEIKGEGQVGLITYMRTDSMRVSVEAQAEALNFIKKEYGENYVPQQPNFYKSKKSSQDAHEAIRPTSIWRTPEKLKDSLDSDQYKLYSLIWKRFVASQMTNAIFDDTKIKVSAGPYLLTATGSVLKFDGFLRVYEIPQEINRIEDIDKGNGEEKEETAENQQLPDVTQGENLNLLDIISEQKFTQPPPLYNDATLVKALEEKDIGRPSTYAPIIATLLERKYVTREKKGFIPTELGIVVNDILVKSFPDLINEEYTAKMEDSLDNIEDGKIEWRNFLKEFYQSFEPMLKNAESHMNDLKNNIQEDTGQICDKCGGKMIIKWGRFGKFLSCEKYPECKNAKPLNGGPVFDEKIGEKCPDCGSELIKKMGPYGAFIACEKYPQCKYTKQILIETGVLCPECGTGKIVERTFKRYRKFYGCSNYPQCKFMTWDKPLNQKCPKCDANFLLEKITKNKITIYCKKCEYKETKEINNE
ncbi:MAG: type I DNA topoisomerase [Candidatus Goldbacteria bacterium]|nr:type I DNA topoisomerase [Candidatus Goldiibacteriota bacterium]